MLKCSFSDHRSFPRLLRFPFPFNDFTGSKRKIENLEEGKIGDGGEGEEEEEEGGGGGEVRV